jgi:hypothetical protein
MKAAKKKRLGVNHAPVEWMNDKMQQHLQVVAFNEHWSMADRVIMLPYSFVSIRVISFICLIGEVHEIFT